MKKILFLLFFCFLSSLYAQESEHKESHTKHPDHGKNFVLFEYGYTHIAEAVAYDNILDKEGYWVSSFGIDYIRILNKKWRIGIKLDLELGHYVIPHKDNLKRENVFIATPILAYSFLPGWGIYTGPGIEFEESKNLFIYKLGTDYAFPLSHGWEVPVGFFVDFKEGYNTYAFTVGIGKVF